MLDYSAPCAKDTGFFFLPVSFAAELVSQGCCSEMDALLDLWTNTVYNDEQVQGFDAGQVAYLRNGTDSTARSARPAGCLLSWAVRIIRK